MKKILILAFSFLLIGCSAEYTLTIDGNSYNENITIQSLTDEDKELIFSNTWMIPIDYSTYNQLDDSDYIVDDSIEYYEYTPTDNSINFTYNFNSNNIQESTALHKCYKSSRIARNNNQIIITTDKENTCFMDNSELDNMTINIVVNEKKVIYNNADSVVGNKYIWNVNRNNYQNKSINMTIEYKSENIGSSSESVSQSTGKYNILNGIYIDYSLVIFAIIFLVIGGIVVYIYIKIKKDDI